MSANKRPKTLREVVFTDAEADAIIHRFIIAQLENDTWHGGLDLSPEAQGALVRASNRLARRLRKALKAHTAVST